MKAWIVSVTDRYEATVVFADTRGKAKAVAMYTDACEDAEFCYIEAHRVPKLDKYYTEGKTEMEWSNPQDRLVLVKECGFSCERVDLDMCEMCSARDYCITYEDYTEAYAGEGEI